MTSESELEALRREIDEIDRQLLELLASRMRLVLSVGDYKRERELAVHDPERERRVLERLAQEAPAPLTADCVRRIFERLIDESRLIEQRHMDGTAQ